MTEPPGRWGILAFVAGCGLVLTAVEVPLRALASSESALVERVNAVRREHHLKPLRHSDALAEVARAHTRDMARGGYLSHVNPRGQNPLDRVRAAGVEGFRLLAENIGASNVSGDRLAALVESWLASPIHRENLLNPAFNTTGIGVAESSDGQTIATQLFATFTDPDPAR